MSELDRIVEVIEKERVKQKLSQRELSKRAGLSSATYHFWIRRQDGGNVATMLAFMRALNIELKINRP